MVWPPLLITKDKSREWGMVSKEEILEELAAIGFARVTDYLTVAEGELSLKDWKKLGKREKAAIASVEKTSSGLKVKFYDKMKALELLGKVFGLFEGGIGMQEENNLLEAILAATKEEVLTYDLPEIQQAAADRHELVEPSRTSGL